MEIELNNEMLETISIKHATEWDMDILIDELVYLYKELSKHDKELKDTLISNYQEYKEEA